MAGLNKDDLKQMNRSYFQSLSQERLVEVADNLHQLATELWEKQQQNSENSSQPPSKDNPYRKTRSRTAQFRIWGQRVNPNLFLPIFAQFGEVLREGMKGVLKESEWWDSNPRPLRPERSALPSCATSR